MIQKNSEGYLIIHLEKRAGAVLPGHTVIINIRSLRIIKVTQILIWYKEKRVFENIFITYMGLREIITRLHYF